MRRERKLAARTPAKSGEAEWRRAFRRLMKETAVSRPRWNEAAMADRLRRTVFELTQAMLDSAAESGDRELLLRMLPIAYEPAGLARGSSVSVSVGVGTSDSLPDLSHLSDEKLAELTRAPGGANAEAALPAAEGWTDDDGA